MRAIHLVLLAWAAFGGTAVAQDVGNAANTESETNDMAAIHFDLAAPKTARPESLPVAATLGDLTYATENPPAAKPARTSSPKASLKPAPRPARKAVAAKASQNPPMSAWRSAYIAKHHHQPPVPAR